MAWKQEAKRLQRGRAAQPSAKGMELEEQRTQGRRYVGSQSDCGAGKLPQAPRYEALLGPVRLPGRR